jgi:glycogen debranching enzyme
MAALHEIPFDRYYGSVDATPLFVMLAGAYYAATRDRELIERLWPNILRALRWIDEHGDLDGDGFVEYERRSEHGLVQQGWKDSSDAVFHADGSPAQPPVALCEVQGYVYAAKEAAAPLAAALGDDRLALELREQALTLQRRFDEAYWCEEIGSYALALDGRKEQCRVRSSNAGHALFTGIALPRRARRLAETLLGAELYSGWGVRTVGAAEARYNPMSYHNGSVWPHDNALIADGLARYKLKDEALRVLRGLYDASFFFDLQRVPELFCGFERQDGGRPTLYPLANAPQAWAAATPFMLLRACLGMTLDATRGQLRFTKPALPDFLEVVRLSGLAVGDAAVDLELRRYGDDVNVTVTGREGDLEVLTVE